MGRSHRRLHWLFGTIGLATGSCVSGQTPATVTPTTVAQAVTPKSIELLVATRMFNTTEPCGCTSTPLGDIARIAALLKQAPESSLLLDAGGLRYEPKSLPPSKQAQARLKADFIENTWQELAALVMVQPEDLLGQHGQRELAGHRRLVANLTGLPSDTTVPREIRTRLGLRLGVIGIADPGATWPTGVRNTAGKDFSDSTTSTSVVRPAQVVVDPLQAAARKVMPVPTGTFVKTMSPSDESSVLLAWVRYG